MRIIGTAELNNAGYNIPLTSLVAIYDIHSFFIEEIKKMKDVINVIPQEFEGLPPLHIDQMATIFREGVIHTGAGTYQSSRKYQMWDHGISIHYSGNHFDRENEFANILLGLNTKFKNP
jgi:hypothetical protein